MAKDTKKSSQRSKRSNIQAFALTVLLLLLVVQTAILWRNGTLPNLLSTIAPSLSVPGTSRSGGSLKLGAPTPSPTPTRLKQGKETYFISKGGSANEPTFSALTLDPHEPGRGQQQSIIVPLTSLSSIRSVNAIFVTDTKTRTIPLRLTDGTNLNGTWQMTWTVDDTLLYTYIIKIVAESENGATAVSEIGIRRPAP